MQAALAPRGDARTYLTHFVGGTRGFCGGRPPRGGGRIAARSRSARTQTVAPRAGGPD